MHLTIRLACLLSAALGLSACAPMLAVMGSSPGVIQVITQIERVKLLGDGASYATSNKTITDYALSKISGKECKIFNVLTKESVCADKSAVVATDSNAQPKAEPDINLNATAQAQATDAPEPQAIQYSHEQAAG